MIRRVRLARSRNLTLANLLDELLPLSGNRPVSYDPSFIGLDGASLPEQRFQDLFAEVCAMSRFLVEEAGLRPGGRVAIFKTNDLRCFRWLLAVVRAGGVAVPLNPLLTLAEVRVIVARCGISIVVTDRAVFESAIRSVEALPVHCWVHSADEPPVPGFLRLTADSLEKPPLPPASVGPSDTVAIFHTSGTDGSPKGAMLSSRALLAGRAIGLLAAPLVGRSSLALFPLPWAHIMAVSTALYGLLAGVPAYCMPRFDAQAAIEVIRKRRITVVIGVPAMFIRLVDAAPAPASLSSVRLWVSASDHLPAVYRRRLLRYGALFRGVGSVFLNAYGMVELGGIAMFGVDAAFLPTGGEYCLRVPPLHIRVADEQGRATRPGEVGECQVRGPGVTGQYWGDSSTTPRSLTPDKWLRTGDLAVRNRLGFIRLVGRAKDVVKCGGYSVFPREIEEVLASHPDVVRAAAIGIPHPDLGEELVAVVERQPGAAPSEEEMLRWCRERVAVYKLPRRILLREAGSFPQGVTEKVLKRVLRDQLTGGPLI